MAARVAVEQGFTNVARYVGGMSDWVGSGYLRTAATAAGIAILLNAGATPIDLRDATAFDAGHITDALNVAAADVPTVPTPLLDLDTSAVVVLYGAGGINFNDLVAVMFLEGFGFTKVVYYTGGWADWSAQDG